MTSPPAGPGVARHRPTGPDRSRLGGRWLSAGIASVLVAAVIGVATGPVPIPIWQVVLELADRLPLIDIDSSLSPADRAIVWDLRAPRVALGLLVGALLAGSGAAYQGVFRNPLADPYLLGIAAGAGLGATIAIVTRLRDAVGFMDPVPLAAFVGALLAVAAAGTLSTRRGSTGSSATLILAGVAVANFFTAIQTFIQQQNSETLQQVFAWILGRLSTAGWGEVRLLAPTPSSAWWACCCRSGPWTSWPSVTRRPPPSASGPGPSEGWCSWRPRWVRLPPLPSAGSSASSGW